MVFGHEGSHSPERGDGKPGGSTSNSCPRKGLVFRCSTHMVLSPTPLFPWSTISTPSSSGRRPSSPTMWRAGSLENRSSKSVGSRSPRCGARQAPDRQLPQHGAVVLEPTFSPHSPLSGAPFALRGRSKESPFRHGFPVRTRYSGWTRVCERLRPHREAGRSVLMSFEASEAGDGGGLRSMKLSVWMSKLAGGPRAG